MEWIVAMVTILILWTVIGISHFIHTIPMKHKGKDTGVELFIMFPASLLIFGLLYIFRALAFVFYWIRDNCSK